MKVIHTHGKKQTATKKTWRKKETEKQDKENESFLSSYYSEVIRFLNITF